MHVHAKDLATHTRMKKRHDIVKQDIEEMKRELDGKKAGVTTDEKEGAENVVEDVLVSVLPLIEQDKDDTSSEEESEEEKESDDEEDDTADLMKELEKIKQERVAQQLKTQRQVEEKMRGQVEEMAMQGNPLLTEMKIKRRWDDDVVFKNQGGASSEIQGKRFINDLIRSDFHKKFMGKYMK